VLSLDISLYTFCVIINFSICCSILLDVRILALIPFCVSASSNNCIIFSGILRSLLKDQGNVDLRGFTGISSEVGPGAQEFKVKVNIKSSSASSEQIAEIYEIGKRLSPAFDTLTNGTSVIAVNTS
jgi:hypothetical protein